MPAFSRREEPVLTRDILADIDDQEFQEEQIQEGENVHSIPQFFAA